jgi:peptidoglycan/xylan/chitin deacetylase (PgdA/CDA1 family)/CelD/BcsL family acetyltransferase involved in cellulose biosynthesis
MTAATVIGPSAVSPAQAVAHVIRDVWEWDRLEPEWDKLFAHSPAASPPLQFRWLREWWQVYGPVYGDGGRGLRVIVVRKDGRFIGALPLYEQHAGIGPLTVRRLGFISTGEAEFEETCPENLDLLYAPGERAACLQAISPVLNSEEVRWDELDLMDIPGDSSLLGLADDFREECRATIEPRGACAIADIAGGLDAYFSRLSANSRQHCRRLLRRAQRAGATMEVATTTEDAAEYFEQLVALHQCRWTQAGQPGCFAAERFTRFHRALAQEWVPAGRAVLARLVAGGEPLAVIYGFITGAKFDFYQSGVRIDGPGATGRNSPDPVASSGIVAFLLLMEHLAGRGVELFDFLRANGDSSYKHRLSTHSRPLCRLTLARPTVRRSAMTALHTVGRAVNRARRRPKSAAMPPAHDASASNGHPRPSRTDIAATVLERTGLGATIRAVGGWRGLLALAYHRIGDGSNSPFDRALWSATTDEFDSQIRLLKHHVDIVSPDDLSDIATRRHGRHVLITFDDGYRDNYKTAFPILRSHGIAALFLVTTGFIDRSRLSWWDEIAWMVRTSRRREILPSSWINERIEFDEPDRERAIAKLLAVYKALPGDATTAYLDELSQATGSGRYAGDDGASIWMTWDMLREMQQEGMAVGGHTVTHPILANLAPDQQCEEIAGCAKRIREEMGRPMRCLSYPSGKPGTYDGHTKKCLTDEGVEFAFSAYGGLNRPGGWESYNVRRTGVEMNRSRHWLKLALTLPQIFT